MKLEEYSSTNIFSASGTDFVILFNPVVSLKDILK